MQKFKRTAAFLTAVTMTFSLFPTAAFASNEQGLEVSGLTEDYVYSEGLSPQYLTKAEGLVAINDFEYGYEASETSEHYNNYSIRKASAADTFIVDDITYQIILNDDNIPTNNVQILKCQNENGDVIIPSTVENNGITYTVISVGAESFLNCDGITNITLPNSVKSIEEFAFSSCSKLKSVSLSDGLERMGQQIFFNCLALEEIDIPDSVTTMGEGMFINCTNLKNVKLPNNDKLGAIPANTFENCYSLTSIGSTGSGASVEFPETITDIGVAAFAYSGLAGKVDILQGVKNIGKSAFEGCTKMTSVNITSSVTTISDTAFYGCSSLKKAWVPNNVTTMGTGVFAKCSSLNDVRLSASLIELPANTFQDCDSIKSVGYYNVDNPSEYIAADVQLPDTMEIIGEGAFRYCNRQPQDPKGQPEAEEYSNEEDYGLKTVDLPESIAVIEDKAFVDCKYLTQIYLQDGLKSIGDYAFTMSGLTDIDFPNSVTSIGYGAFESCESLENIAMPTGKVEENGETEEGTPIEERLFGDRVFSGCIALKQVDLSDTNIYVIGSDAFSGCISLEEVIIPDTVIAICESAFYNCYSLTEIELPNNLESIGLGAFCDCKGLTQITIPAKVNYIGYGAFYDCINLKDVTVQNQTPPILDVYNSSFLGPVSTLQENQEFDNNCDTFKNCSSELKINIPVGTKADYNETLWSNYTLKCSCYISGAITDESGNSISNVKVTIFDEDENEIVTEYTDSNGQYTTYDMALEDGNYILKFSKDGYIERTETITANGTNIFDADFVLNGYKVYTVTEGTDGAYEKGSAKGLKFVCDVDYTKFKEIMVDGAVVDNSNYKAESGSTVITLKSSYLDALNAGAHTLRVNFEDGYAETNFTVNSTETNNPSQNGNTATGNSSNNGTNTGNGSNSNISNSNKTPKTGDQSFIMLSCALVGAAALSMGVLKRKRNSR